jgi:acyl-CoA reductase-like NAD-dependent aldehyde dehydrogenase
MASMVSQTERQARMRRLWPDTFGTIAPLWIAGAWRPGAKSMQTMDPTTGEVLTEVAIASSSEVDAAVAAALAAGRHWWGMDGQDRARILNGIAAGIRAKAHDLGVLDTLDAGRPIRDSATRDPERAARIFEYFSGVTDRLRGAIVPVQPGRSNRVEYEPYGVVGAITPWNYPLTNAAGKIAPALATGNAVILKPAEQSPLSALLLAAIANEAGLPAGLLAVLNGPGPLTGELIVRHPSISKLTFTGSTAVGRLLAGTAGSLLKSVTLELGGKTPFIIFPDADLETAADALVYSMVNNAGQTCTAATRIVVHRKVAEAFLTKFGERIGRLTFGDPLDPDTRVGPIISAEQHRKIAAYVEDARRRGVDEYPLPRRDLPPYGFFFEPVIFTGVEANDPLAREEIFGPITVVIVFDDEEEAIALANGTQYGLAASLWTDSANRIHRFVPRLECGLVWVNSVHSLHPGSPYGGHKQSGLGLEMGLEAVHQHMRVKSVWLEHGRWRSPWAQSNHGSLNRRSRQEGL